MPKLPVLTPRDVIRILEKSVFIFDRAKGSHHIYLHPTTKQRAVVLVHRRDLPQGTLLSILKQAGIEREELIDLL
jgi:predicted RNA binding protein YcfA (HicA-like mRNA interferase family)